MNGARQSPGTSTTERYGPRRSHNTAQRFRVLGESGIHMRTIIALGFTVLAGLSVACDKDATEALSVPVPPPVRPEPTPVRQNAVSTTEVTSAQVPAAKEAVEAAKAQDPSTQNVVE